MKHIIPALTVIAILLTLAAGYPAQTVSASVHPEEEPPVSAPLFPEADVYSSDAPEPKSIITDLYGNTLNNDPASPPAFVALHEDPTKKIDVSLENGFKEIPIGFTFPFYENVYSSSQIISVCVDGLLAIGPAPAYRDFNTTLPFEAQPNNIIAALWDDLAIDTTNGHETSGVYVSSTSSVLIVEWYQLIPSGHNTNRLTFEAFLYPSGQIYLLYQTITQPMLSATIGIEDSAGYTGLAYLYNTDGIASGDALHIQRPADPNIPRARFIDGHQSQLAYGRAAVFPIAFQNTSTNAQTFALSATFPEASADWTAELCATVVCSQLINSTGLLAPGQTFHFYLRLSARVSAPVGSRVAVHVKATAGNPLKTWQALFESAIPAGFSQAVADSSGLSQLLVWDSNIYHSRLSPYFPGANMSLVAGKDLTLYAWEWQGTAPGGIDYTNITVATLNRFGQVIDAPAVIDDHSSVTVDTRDTYPNLAVAPNGTLAAIFKRERFKFDGQPCYNDNIMISWKQAGQEWARPFKLTANSDNAWRCLANEAPGFSHPRLIALPDNRFAVTWVELKRVDGIDYSNLRVWVFNPSIPAAPAAGQGYPVPQVDYSQYEYFSPTLVAKEDTIVLFYVFKDNVQAKNPIQFAVLDSSGNYTGPYGEVNYSDSDNSAKIDTALLSDGKIALVWKDFRSLQVKYTLLSQTYVPVTLMPGTLLESHILQADTLSVSAAQDGRAVITWGDWKWQRALAYALVGPNAGIVTQPILFVHTSATNPVVQTSTNGQGVSTYEGSYRSYAPVVGR